jgi:hypothetical protein
LLFAGVSSKGLTDAHKEEVRKELTAKAVADIEKQMEKFDDEKTFDSAKHKLEEHLTEAEKEYNKEVKATKALYEKEMAI